MIVEYLLAGLVCLLLVGGAVFSLLASLGLLRFPDVYSRMHAASKAGTVGSGLILIGFAVQAPDFGSAARALAALLFLVTTAPVAAHILARAASLVRDPPIKIIGRKNQH